MALAWREALTTAYLGDYIKNKRYYKLLLTSDVDNTDQVCNLLQGYLAHKKLPPPRTLQ